MNQIQHKLFIIALIIFASFHTTQAQTTTFTYQGKLTDSAMAANGTYDLGFALYDAPTGGNQIGTSITRPAVNVSNGIFTVSLDFGANAFPGADRYLQIAVKRPSDTNYTTLTPRQPISSAPYSIRALNATNSSNLGGTAANQFVQTNDSRLTDARTPTAGSANYIQNTTTQQTSSNFNISGTGTANIFNTATQYNFGGSRILGVPNSTSVTLGLNAGNTLGGGNTDNTFVGSNTGVNCQTATNLGNCLGNTYLGRNAGASQIIGSGNTFIGIDTGNVSPGGGSGVSLGGSNNTLIGARSSLTDQSLDHATAIGADSYAAQSNSIVLGRNSGADQVVSFGIINAQSGISLNDRVLHLRDSSDDFHTISYNSGTNGMIFRTFDTYQWFNFRNNRVNMQLNTNGDLAIVGNYLKISDARYKTNVQTINSPLDSIRRLRGVTYNWIPEFNNSAKQIGFIAQEVEQVLPEMVHTDEKGFKSVAYSDAVPVLVEAIKEQQKQIDEQKVLINSLKTLVCSQNPGADVCK